MRAAPQNRMVTLMGCLRTYASIRLQGVGEQIVEHNGVGGVRHAVGRTDRANAGRDISRASRFRKQRMRDDGIDRRRAGSVRALAQAIMVPPDETISSTIRAGRPAKTPVRKFDLDRAVAAAGLSRNV